MGEFLNEFIDGDDVFGEDKEILLSNWFVIVVEIEKCKCIVCVK